MIKQLAITAAAGLMSAVAFLVQAEASGPDFFAVTGAPVDGQVQLHTGPSADQAVAGALSEGQVVRNLGCEGEGSDRWCRVGTLADESVDGWLPSQYLAEAEAAPPSPAGAGRSLASGDAPGEPSVYQRGSGEFEVNFQGGCGALFDQRGKRITAGSSCSADQLKAAAGAVEALGQN